MQLQRRATGKHAAIVVEAGSTDIHAPLADQRTVTAVEQGARQLHIQHTAAAGEGAEVTVVEAATVEGQALPAGQQAMLVVDASSVDHHMPSTDQLAVAVVEAVGGECQVLLAGEFTAGIVEGANLLQGQRALGQDQAAAVVQIVAVEVQGRAAATEQAAALVVQVAAVQVENACRADQALLTVVE
ncbi:hypothetical protein D3C81_528410 [compost metagenome]